MYLALTETGGFAGELIFFFLVFPITFGVFVYVSQRENRLLISLLSVALDLAMGLVGLALAIGLVFPHFILCAIFLAPFAMCLALIT